jgi:site-specific recombinase XerD
MSSYENTIAWGVEAYLRDLGILRSARTVKTYATTLHHLVAFCGERGQPADALPISALTPDLALDFVRWLSTEHKLKTATLHNYLTALARFYRWLMLEDKASFAASDYARLQERLADIRGRGLRRSLPRVPAEDAVQALLAAAYDVPLPDAPGTSAGRRATLLRLRNIALLEVLRSTGARVGEIVSLYRSDLDHTRRAAVVTGKGQKQRLIYFDEVAWRAVDMYLRERRDGASGRPLASFPLFARHDRGAGSQLLPITTNTARAVLDELTHLAGLDETITPHLLRHRFATGILAATGNLAATQDLLGHASPNTTRIYTHLTDNDAAVAHRQAQENGRI